MSRNGQHVFICTVFSWLKIVGGMLGKCHVLFIGNLYTDNVTHFTRDSRSCFQYTLISRIQAPEERQRYNELAPKAAEGWLHGCQECEEFQKLWVKAAELQSSTDLLFEWWTRQILKPLPEPHLNPDYFGFPSKEREQDKNKPTDEVILELPPWIVDK